MAHLHLPAQHDEDDVALARALAGILESRDLYVTWTTASGRARPVVPRPSCRPPRRRRRLAGLLDALSRRRTA